MKFFANGKNILEYGVVQNETGVYYFNGKTYFKPLLKDFDTATPPAGYKKYTNGSHASYLSQRALDFSVPQGYIITCDTAVTPKVSSTNLGSFVKIQVGTKIVYLVHTYQWGAVGKAIPAGKPICQIAPQSVSKAAPHLHIYGDGFKIRDSLMATLKIGDIIEFTDTTNVRKGNATTYDITAKAVKGAKGKIKDGPRAGSGYTWYDIEFLP